MTQPSYSPDVVPCDFWLFLKLKLPLKGNRFQTISEIQENTTGQLMATGRTVWGPKVPTLKGTEASVSYVQCFLYLVFSSKNVSIFHTTWLTTFWTDLVYVGYGWFYLLCFINCMVCRRFVGVCWDTWIKSVTGTSCTVTFRVL